LKEIFEEFGKVRNIKIPIDKYSNKKKGFVFIQFELPESAKLAVKTGIIAYNEDKSKRIIDFNEKSERPRSIKIKFADPRPDWTSLVGDSKQNTNEKRIDLSKKLIKNLEDKNK